MRSFKTAIIIFALLIASAFFYNYVLYHTSKTLSESLSPVITLLREEKFDDAYLLLVDFEEEYEKFDGLLAVLINHYETDQIKSSIKKLIEYCRGNEKTESLAEAANLHLLVSHLAQKESVNIRNIL